MFFLATVLPREESLHHMQSGICPCCGKFGTYRVWMQYSCLALFLIPLFKFGRHYYVQLDCCGAVYELNQEIGKAIAKGEAVEILPEDMMLLQQGVSRCPHCGQVLAEMYSYCPHCGEPLERRR